MLSIIDLGVEHGIIDKKGTWYSYNEKRLGQGKEATRAELKGNPELADEIEQKIFEKVQGTHQEEPALV